jgi:copper chaperone CopZ
MNRWAKGSAALLLVLATGLLACSAARAEEMPGHDGDYAAKIGGVTADNAQKIQDALKKVEGVKDAHVDATGAAKITVGGDHALRQDEVAKAVKEAGGELAWLNLPEGQELVWLMTYTGGGG